MFKKMSGNCKSDKRYGSSSRGTFIDKMKSFDKFEARLPGFTIAGKDTVRSKFGAFCSMIITAIVLLYALIKLIHL